MNLDADNLVMRLRSAAGPSGDAWEQGFTVIREEQGTRGLEPTAVSLGDGRGNDHGDMFGLRLLPSDRASVWFGSYAWN